MDKYLCILAELDEESQSSLKMYEAIISENGIPNKATKDLPYHITLNTYSVEQEDYLCSLLDEVAPKHKPIYVAYTGFGLFGLNVIFLNPAMNAPLIELYDDVKEMSNSKWDVFAAHTTLFIGEPENTLKLLPIFTERAKRTTGRVKNLSLNEFFPARFIKRIELIG